METTFSGKKICQGGRIRYAVYKRRFTGADKTGTYRSAAGSAIVCPYYIRLTNCEDALPQNLECYDVNMRRVVFVAVPCFKAVCLQVLKTVEKSTYPTELQAVL